jgi:uncharacterized C2H2 Zn-finger protein
VDSIISTEESRTKCGKCDKLFRDKDCAVKHLHKKHADILKPKANEIRVNIFRAGYDNSTAKFWVNVKFEGDPNEGRAPRPEGGWAAPTEPYQDYDDPEFLVKQRSEAYVERRTLVDYTATAS